MRSVLPSREGVEHGFRQMLRDHGLPQPDEVRPHEDGGIVCLWHEERFSVIVDLEPLEGATYDVPL